MPQNAHNSQSLKMNASQQAAFTAFPYFPPTGNPADVLVWCHLQQHIAFPYPTLPGDDLYQSFVHKGSMRFKYMGRGIYVFIIFNHNLSFCKYTDKFQLWWNSPPFSLPVLFLHKTHWPAKEADITIFPSLRQPCIELVPFLFPVLFPFSRQTVLHFHKRAFKRACSYTLCLLQPPAIEPDKSENG